MKRRTFLASIGAAAALWPFRKLARVVPAAPVPRRTLDLVRYDAMLKELYPESLVREIACRPVPHFPVLRIAPRDPVEMRMISYCETIARGPNGFIGGYGGCDEDDE